MPSINSPTPDATTTTNGKIRLAGDLGGTAASPVVSKINGTVVNPKVLIYNPYVEGVPLYSMGHSYTMYPYPYGTAYNGEYPMRIKNRLRMGDVWLGGKSGLIAVDNFARMISSTYDGGTGKWSPNSKGVGIIQNTLNEMLFSTDPTNSTYRTMWADCLRGEIAIMQSSSILGWGDKTAVAGTWTTDVTNPGAKGYQGITYLSNTINSTANFSVSGDSVWVIGIASASADVTLGTLSVICNGVTVATFNGTNKKTQYVDKIYGSNQTYTPYPFKVTGLTAAAGTAGTKTIQVKSDAGGVITGLSGIILPMANPPTILLAKEPPVLDSAYQTIYTANIGYYNGVIDTIATEFSNCFTVDLATNYDTATMSSSAGANFHPNDKGLSCIADNIVDAINLRVTTWKDGVVVI